MMNKFYLVSNYSDGSSDREYMESEEDLVDTLNQLRELVDSQAELKYRRGVSLIGLKGYVDDKLMYEY